MSAAQRIEKLRDEIRFHDEKYYQEARPVISDRDYDRLMQELIDGTGERWPMAALIPGAARMSSKLAALGYWRATALRPNLLADSGQTLRGHEFRYSTWECETPVSNAAAVALYAASVA